MRPVHADDTPALPRTVGETHGVTRDGGVGGFRACVHDVRRPLVESARTGPRGWLTPARMSEDMREVFRRFAARVAALMGSPWAFTSAGAIIAAWAVTGPIFRFSGSWPLAINTGTTIVTFLMVFVIQNTQNREALALNLKIDELLRAVAEARNSFVDLEELSDEEIQRLQQQFRLLRQTEALRLRTAGADEQPNGSR